MATALFSAPLQAQFPCCSLRLSSFWGVFPTCSPSIPSLASLLASHSPCSKSPLLESVFSFLPYQLSLPPSPLPWPSSSLFPSPLASPLPSPLSLPSLLPLLPSALRLGQWSGPWPLPWPSQAETGSQVGDVSRRWNLGVEEALGQKLFSVHLANAASGSGAGGGGWRFRIQRLGPGLSSGLDWLCGLSHLLPGLYFAPEDNAC